MSRKKSGSAAWRKWIVAGGAGTGLYLLLSLLSAYLILEEKLPAQWGSLYLCVCAAVGAFAAGFAVGGGAGKLLRGAFAGAICAVTILCIKGACYADAIWTVYTTGMVASCLVFGSLGSCIIHKKAKKATGKRIKPLRRK